MAEKADRKSESPPAGAGAAPKEGEAKKASLLKKTPVLIGGVMLLEALVLFTGFKLLGGSGPKAAPGAELTEAGGEGHGDGHGSRAGGGGKGGDAKRTVELQVVDFKAPNKMSGRTFLFDVSIYAVTKGASEEKVKAALKDREALIKDRIRTIIAQGDPEKLMGSAEPGLETLRRQVKYQLDEIVGEGLIDEVLVPRCIPFRTDY